MKIIKRLRSLPGDSLGIIRRTPPLVFAMAVLSLGGFIGASTVLVRGFRMVENSITVTGASTESFESDIAKWSVQVRACLLYTSPSPRDLSTSRMPSSA